MRIALVFNPHASARRLTRIEALARHLEASGHCLSQHNSTVFNCARDAADTELVCVAGGDGTVRKVVEAHGKRADLPPFAIFPCGTINLLARELGYPSDQEAFARRICGTQQPRSSTLAFAGKHPLLACASIGADALAVAGLSERLKARIGRLAYVVALARHLWSWPRPQLDVTIDGASFPAEALFVLRGAFYAGPWTLDRRARLSSEYLHVLALPFARRRDLVMLAIYALSGARRLPRGWRLLAAREVSVAAPESSPVQVDGDIVGILPVRFTMSSDRLRWA